jgi:acyl transferase domain-containing protein
VTSKFEPVAIVGQACLLPGAHSPEELWSLVLEGRVAISHLPATRWRADRETMLASGACFTDCAGFVDGFERIWSPAEYSVDPVTLADLDPLFQWLLHTGRSALLDARVARGITARTGAIIGNLG